MNSTGVEDVTSTDEVNRLIGLGLDKVTAMAVAAGKLNETFEVARAQERRDVERWCKDMNNIPTDLEAVWDTEPSRIYLAFDGDNPEDHPTTDFTLIEADVSEVDGMLTYISSRDRGPWDEPFKAKSCGIVYRWVKGLGVTPPVLTQYKQQIHIVGGVHRFHLAKHYGTTRMPFLVRRAELATVMGLLRTATTIDS